MAYLKTHLTVLRANDTLEAKLKHARKRMKQRLNKPQAKHGCETLAKASQEPRPHGRDGGK